MKEDGKTMSAEVLLFVFGVISLFYGIFIFSLHSGANTFLLWFGIGGCLLLGGAAFHKGIWSGIPAGVKVCIIGIFTLGFASFLIVEGCILSGFFARGKADLDYVIVLGAQVREDGPSPVLKHRLDTAYEYLEENENTICIVSGGQGAKEPMSEARGMYDYLVKKGLPEERILMEDQSLTTAENLANSKEFLEENSSVGIVTNNFHVFRGVRLAKYVGIKEVYGIAAPNNPFYVPNNMLREYFGVLKDLSKIIS